MILKKPLAFLIRHFKLIHFFLVLISIYLIYKTSGVLVFFNEYITSTSSLIGSKVASSLITPPMYIMVFVMMLGTTLILTILKLKDKPIKFYIFNILVCVAVLVIFLYDYTVLETLENKLVEIKTLELARDLLVLSLIVQNLSLIWLGIRAIGFDIKSFRFDENIDELEITEEDSEEIEVDLSVDKHLYTRRFNKFKRFFKYLVKENKLLVTLGLLIVFAIGMYIAYLNSGIYDRVLNTNHAFTTNEFILDVEDSYYTETDNLGNKLLEDDGFVVLRLRSKVKGNKVKKLNIGRFALIVNDKKFYHNADYKDKLMDLGYTYLSEEIGTEFVSYLLVFEVPKELSDKKMILRYTDINTKDIKINVTPLNLTKNKDNGAGDLGTELVFKGSPLRNTIFKIDQYAVSDRFKIDYNYCDTENNCYPSYEYVTPTTSGNYNKSLLKLVGSVEIDSSLSIEPITTVYKFMRYFARINYTVGGNTKILSSDIKRVMPLKTNNQNEYYIEVPSEVKDAESIEIVFNIRNYVYKYKIK